MKSRTPVLWLHGATHYGNLEKPGTNYRQGLAEYFASQRSHEDEYSWHALAGSQVYTFQTTIGVQPLSRTIGQHISSYNLG